MALWRRSSSWLTSCSRAPAGIGGGNETKVSPEVAPERRQEEVDEERWFRLLHELLTDIVRRVDGAERWPPRRDVVACACVCCCWRDAAVSVVRPPIECGRITFPFSLKQAPAAHPRRPAHQIGPAAQESCQPQLRASRWPVVFTADRWSEPSSAELSAGSKRASQRQCTFPFCLFCCFLHGHCQNINTKCLFQGDFL